MCLHGSNVTNFVDIMSQRLQIAHPKALATGYNFGKGLYFTYLVSKRAWYFCSVDDGYSFILWDSQISNALVIKKESMQRKPLFHCLELSQ